MNLTKSCYLKHLTPIEEIDDYLIVNQWFLKNEKYQNSRFTCTGII